MHPYHSELVISVGYDLATKLDALMAELEKAAGGAVGVDYPKDIRVGQHVAVLRAEGEVEYSVLVTWRGPSILEIRSRAKRSGDDRAVATVTPPIYS